MRKYVLVFSILIPIQNAMTQNVGIGITTPQAPFHIRSLSAVEMLRIEGVNPYISFFNGGAYSGYLWYNTNKMELGTPMGSGEPVLIAPGRVATAYFTTSGRVGLGTATPSTTLDVLGNVNISGVLRFDGSSGNSGQVLTSNGGGSPTWQTPPATLSAFHTENSLPLTIPSPLGSGIKIEFNAEVFDDGGDFNTTTDAYTAPANGVYHFDVKVTFYDADPGNYRMWLDNNTNYGDGYYAVTYQEFGAAGHSSLLLSITMRLTSGQQVLAHVWHSEATDQTASFCYFSGYRVY